VSLLVLAVGQATYMASGLTPSQAGALAQGAMSAMSRAKCRNEKSGRAEWCRLCATTCTAMDWFI